MILCILNDIFIYWHFKLYYSPQQNNLPAQADTSLWESAEIDQLIGTKLRMALYMYTLSLSR